MNRLIPILFLPLLLTFSPQPTKCWSESNSKATIYEYNDVNKRYQRAKFYYNQLETNSSIGNSRANWLKGVRNFRKIYLTRPRSGITPACLFMLGRMYHRMYEKFDTLIDLNESISHYRKIANHYPQHKLADDSLFAIGTILLNNKKDFDGASHAFDKIVSDYPNGDMHPQAAGQLKALSRDHDIPLPKIMVGSSNLNELANILPLKYWSSEDYTRIVVKASGPVTYKEELLEPDGNRPRRLYVDFYNSYIEPKLRSPVPIEDGLLKQIRTGQFTTDTVRVVLDIQSISSFKVFSLPDPFRVVIDVRGQLKTEPEGKIAQPVKAIVPEPGGKVAQPGKPTGPEKSPDPPLIVLKDNKKNRVNKSAGVASNVSAASLNQQTFSLAQQLGLGVRKIVLDPGHGGKDSGAEAFGLKEKDIVLRLADNLAPVLREQLGCEVILTRDQDNFIPLEERTAIANTSGADLFISLHINAHPAPKVHGLETYYLNLTTNAEAMRVAARENATSTHQMSDLQDILSDILQNSKVNESSRLAKLVHNSIISGLSSGNYPNLKSLGVKQAPFYVLIGAQMPAVLIEVAFLSNPLDAKHLTTDSFIETISQEIANGVQSYIRGTVASLDIGR